MLNQYKKNNNESIVGGKIYSNDCKNCQKEYILKSEEVLTNDIMNAKKIF